LLPFKSADVGAITAGRVTDDRVIEGARKTGAALVRS
jgi:hypothetical protein